LIPLEPEIQQQAWQQAVQQAGGKVPSGRIVKDVVQRIMERTRVPNTYVLADANLLPNYVMQGQYQVLFLAESEKQLLEQIQQVPVNEYKAQRRRLALSEAPRQQKHCLHHDPVSAIQSLVHQHQEILSVLESQALSSQLDS
jgi:hypothetical protein